MLHNTEAVQQAESLLRADARAALDHARAVLEDAVDEVDSHTYQRWLLLKGAAQARVGHTEDGARLMREVREWAEEHQDTMLLALSHRRLSALFRRVGDPALMLEHAVSAVELLDEIEEPVADAIRADHLIGLADALGAGGSFDDAFVRYGEASQLADDCGDDYLRIAVLNNLSYSQYEAGFADEAVATAEQLLAEADRQGVPLQTHDGDTVARAYIAVRRFEDAAAIIEPYRRGRVSGEDCDGVVWPCSPSPRYGAGPATSRRRRRRSTGPTGWLSTTPCPGGSSRASASRPSCTPPAATTSGRSRRCATSTGPTSRCGRWSATAGRGRCNAIFEATEARRSSDFFRELSVRDPLTGLHNRRHLDARLLELLARGASDGADLTVGLVDLDHFKRINDTRSHAVGDEVLRQVAELLQAAAEEVAGRAGRADGRRGVPACCCRASTGPPGVERLEELRRRIAEHPWATVTDGMAVTASIGVASAPGRRARAQRAARAGPTRTSTAPRPRAATGSSR